MTASSHIPDVVRTLIEAGHAAPSADNSQPWQFVWDGQCLSVAYASGRVGDKTFGADEHATLLAMGAVRENIAQMAHELKIDIEPVEPRGGEYFRWTVRSCSRHKDPIRGHPIFERQTDRFSYSPAPLPRDVLDTLGGMVEGRCRVAVVVDHGAITSIAECVRIASELRFQSRDVHEFLTRSLRFSTVEAERGDGLDVRTLNLPPGGKTFLRLIRDWRRLAFLNRFGLYRVLAQLEAKPISRAVALFTVLGPVSPADALDAGALMQRGWLFLTSQGIAAHPYYVVTDQLQRLKHGRIPATLENRARALQSASARLFQPAESEIHMLFRVGFPRTSPIRSRRLPIDRVASTAR